MTQHLDLNDPLFVNANCTIMQALERMDSTKRKLLIVINDNKFYSVLSIGDIQRSIINKIPLENSVKEILRDEITVCTSDESFDEIKNKMIAQRTECMPVLNKNGELVDLYFWEDVFGAKVKRKSANLNLPVIIMAGGKGTRLKPLTNVLPKPLLPIDEKTIIEDIMDRFVEIGCTNFYLSVNYKAQTIKDYFHNLRHDDYKLNYFQEDKPLGTAGSMFLIKDKIKSTFFVSNCDILIDQDLEEIYKYHISNKNLITVVSAVKNYKIPYGTLQTKEDGLLEEINEKPELVFQINTGMYILEPEVLDLIPENQFFHITHLIEKIIKQNGNVGVFPIGENSWQDIGNWDDYGKLLKNI